MFGNNRSAAFIMSIVAELHLCYDPVRQRLRHHVPAKWSVEKLHRYGIPQTSTHHRECPNTRVHFRPSSDALRAINSCGGADYTTLRRLYVQQMLQRGYQVSFNFAGVHVSNDRYVAHYPRRHDNEPVTVQVYPWCRESNPISG